MVVSESGRRRGRVDVGGVYKIMAEVRGADKRD